MPYTVIYCLLLFFEFNELNNSDLVVTCQAATCEIEQHCGVLLFSDPYAFNSDA